MTPNCLRRMLEPYAARLSGFQGYHAFPHTVMGVGDQGPDSGGRDGSGSRRWPQAIRLWLEQTEASLPIGEKMRRRRLTALPVEGRAAAGRRLLRGRLHDRRRRGGTARPAPGIPDPAMASLLNRIEG